MNGEPGVAFFDENGICRLIMRGSIGAAVPPAGYPFEAIVDGAADPNATWYDRATGEAKISDPVDVGAVLGLPDVCPADQALTAAIPADCVAFTNGEQFVGTLVIPAGPSRPIVIDLRGAQYGEHEMMSEEQSADRAAGPIRQQLQELRELVAELGKRVETLERKGT